MAKVTGLNIALATVLFAQLNCAVLADDSSKKAKIDNLKPMHAFVYRDTDDLLAIGVNAKRARSKKAPLKLKYEPSDTDSGKLNWQPWQDSLFEKAKKENKFILLDLEAVWCHWCHVMEEKTYGDPQVVKIIEEKFIPVKVDQDSRPDLSHKYEDYGWPATIIFDSNGQEIVKRSGYIRPERMLRLLNAIVKDPSPEEGQPEKISFSEQSALSKSLKDELIKRHVNGYDSKYGAWGRFHKFLDWDSCEYSMELGLAGDKMAEERARNTLVGQLNLIDPEWGGVYQYSTDGDWKHPHFEKIMQMQAENLRIYSIGYSLYKDKRFLQAAKDIARYLNTFLSSPEGAFYTSQDADLEPGKHSAGYFELKDKARRSKGIPRIDKHVYARENGWAINGMTNLYMATGERIYLERAIKAANWVIKNRTIDGGGFKHDRLDKAGPYLGDNLAMGRAFISLYAATADRQWLKKAEKVAQFIDAHFKNPGQDAGYLTADYASSKVARPEPLADQNSMLARFLNLTYHYTGNEKYKTMAARAMRYLATPEIAKRRKILVAGPLIADWELSRSPQHVTIVGSKKDSSAKALYIAALQSPAIYRRIEWYDKAEGKLPNTDVEYPDLKKAAAFSCGEGICSSPKYSPEEIIQLFTKKM